MAKRIWPALLGLALAAASAAASGQTSLLLNSDDTTFLHTRLGVGLTDERICQLSQAEAERLHRLIRAGDVRDVQAYLDNVTLDQVHDAAHHVYRVDRCAPSAHGQ
jgi:hypothetical protein